MFKDSIEIKILITFVKKKELHEVHESENKLALSGKLGIVTVNDRLPKK